jgi:nitroreductase
MSFDAIRLRRSVRDYTEEPVSHDLLHQLIRAAVDAPSAMNEQPWQFTVITNPDLLQTIAAEAKTSMLKSLPAGSQAEHFRQMLANDKFSIFYNAPSLVVISAPAQSPWSVVDCALAAQNLMLAASAAGLGTCWIGFAQQWLNTDGGRRTINLPADQTAVAPLIVGHPKTTPAPVPRKAPSVRWIE